MDRVKAFLDRIFTLGQKWLCRRSQVLRVKGSPTIINNGDNVTIVIEIREG